MRASRPRAVAVPPSDSAQIRRRYEFLYRQLFSDLDRIVYDPLTRDYGVDAVIVVPGRSILVKEIARQHSYGDILIEVWADHDRQLKGWARVETTAAYLAYGVVEHSVCFWLSLAAIRLAARYALQRWIDLDAGYPRRRWYRDRTGQQMQAWSVAVKLPSLSRAIGMSVERFSHVWR